MVYNPIRIKSVLFKIFLFPGKSKTYVVSRVLRIIIGVLIIKNFANIAGPLTALLRKNVKFQWTAECQHAFDTLKQSLISAPILSFPDFTLPFELYVDASLDGLGMTLGQMQNGKEVVIAYAGRSLNSAELSYSATDKEALAVIEGIKKFQPYYMVANSQFTLTIMH